MSQKVKQNLENRQNTLLLSFRYGQEYQIGEISNLELEDQVSLATLKRDLNQLIDLGYLMLSGEKRSAKYTLTNLGLLSRVFPLNDYALNPKYDKTIFKTYNFELFKILESVDIFSKQEFEILENESKLFHEKSLNKSVTINKKELERFVVELSWKSSKIEGNTYTLLDTERLLLEGIESSTNTKEETQMILNHKNAFPYIFDSSKSGKSLVSFAELQNVHKLLVENLGVKNGMRNVGVGVTGAKYLPLSLPVQIEQETRNLISLIERKKDAYSKALISILGISYIQSFEDGNKRTGRLFANSVLMEAGLAPLSYRDVDEKKYRESLLVFYEQNSIEAFKKIFIEQYIFACRNYNIG